MEFEDMKKIWDGQSNKPMYVIDHDTMVKRVRTKAECIAREVNYEEWGNTIIASFLSAFFVLDAVLDEGHRYSFISAAVFAGVAAYQWRMRARRRRSAICYDESLLGNVNRSLEDLDYLIRRSQTIVWWFLAPTLFVILLTQWLGGSEKSVWSIAVGFLALPIAYAVAQWGLKRRYLPRRRTLENLRAMLLE